MSLDISEAVALATALVQYLARRNGIRMLVLKGPLVAVQGLRHRTHSFDVDVLVEPDRAEDVRNLLRDYGWAPRALPDFPLVMERHSYTFIKPGWNCDIDVHHYWPGFLASPETAFDALWAQRETLPFAGQDIEVPSRPGSALILALHSLREGGFVSERSRQMVEYRDLVEVCRRDDALAAQAHDLARATGSEQTAARFLRDLGREPSARASDAEALRRWELNASAEHPVTAWVVALREAPWHRRPGIVWHGLFPSAAELRAIDPEIGEGRMQVLRGWWRRFRRGMRGLPEAARVVRRFVRRR